MPRPVGGSSVYLPGLDGLRALSVIIVVGYHLGLSTMPGGFLGVGMFFTLSGYLITNILMRTWVQTGTISLKDFWLRRARRLLPAMVLLVGVVLATTYLAFPTEAFPNEFGARLTDTLWSLLYVNNWATILSGASYFERINGPGPLDHLWSLAIEEQFYIVWPVVFLLLLKVTRGRLRLMVGATLALAAISFVLLALLADPGLDNTRAYEGTDTRAGGILLGAALAMVWSPGRHTSKASRRMQLTMDGAGVAALAVLGWLVVNTDDFSISIYRGGLVALSALTCVLVAIVVHPSSLVAKALGVAPLRWIGERSYGIYLWHLPLIVFMPSTFMAEYPAGRIVVLIALTLLTAELSWSLLEDPIRRHGIVGAIRLRRSTAAQSDRADPGAQTAPPQLGWGLAWSATAVFAVAILTGASLVGRSSPATAAPLDEFTAGRTLTKTTAPPDDAPDASTPPSTVPPTDVPPTDVPPTDVPPSSGAQINTTGPVDLDLDLPADPATSLVSLPQSACGAVAHVGDSTSVGLMSESVLPDPLHRIDARYRAVGATDVRTDIAGARSIVETHGGFENAETAVLDLRAAGFDGCFVIAMGTNDAANQVVGSPYTSAQRIDLVMAAAEGRPVLWLTVKSLVTDGPYANDEMAAFSAEVLAACARYANLSVYDWNAEVLDDWFTSDGIHFTSAGYTERGTRTAVALANAFPAGGLRVPGCVVPGVPAPNATVTDPFFEAGTLPVRPVLEPTRVPSNGPR